MTPREIENVKMPVTIKISEWRVKCLSSRKATSSDNFTGKFHQTCTEGKIPMLAKECQTAEKKGKATEFIL